jgi:hypothetical protein
MIDANRFLKYFGASADEKGFEAGEFVMGLSITELCISSA